MKKSSFRKEKNKYQRRKKDKGGRGGEKHTHIFQAVEDANLSKSSLLVVGEERIY
jgi:hypothetical protein